MSRQVQTNTFTEGLNKDLNPIVTPNNVLTDCLNGTIITYNGNEFALQNDLGNYGFKYSGLSNGYIPVGMKEHANILYIISYNPLLDRVEIGSFPSQKTISEANITDRNSSFDIILNKDDINLYTEIKSDLTIISTEVDLLLNPGDKYILQISESGDINKKYEDFEDIYNITLWKHISPYIFTETHRLYNIEGLVDLYTGDIQHPTIDDFKSVKWEVPGWLAIKSMVNVMSEFNAYLTNPKYSYSSGSILSTISDIKLQSIFNKNVYNDTVLNSIKNNLRYIVFVDDRPSQYDSNELKIKLAELNGGSKVLTDNSSFIKKYVNDNISYNSIDEVMFSSFTQGNEGNKYYVHIIPVLRTEDNGNIIYILYDQFYTVLSLYEKEFNSDDITIGKNEFNYSVDNNSLTLNIDINSFPDCKLYKRIRRMPEKTFDTETCENNNLVDVFENGWEEESGYNYNGQNIIDIPFTSITEYNYNKYKSSSNKKNYYNISGSTSNNIDINTGISVQEGSSYALNSFDKEDIYELTIRIYYPGVSMETLDTTDNYCEKKFIIYASDIINYFTSIYDNFNDIDGSGNPLSTYTIFDELDRVIKTASFDKSDFIWTGNTNYYSRVDNNKVVIDNIEDLDGLDYKFDENNILQGFFDKLYSNNEFDYLDKHLYIGGGSEYKINKNINNIISLPLNQYGVVGRMWRDCTYSNNLNINLKDSNDNILNINIDEDGNSTFDLISEYDIKTENIDSFSKQGATRYITIGDVTDSPVSIIGNSLVIKKALMLNKNSTPRGAISADILNSVGSRYIVVDFNRTKISGGKEEQIIGFTYQGEEDNDIKFDISTGNLNSVSGDTQQYQTMFTPKVEEWLRQSNTTQGDIAITRGMSTRAYAPYIYIIKNDFKEADTKKYNIYKTSEISSIGYDLNNFCLDANETRQLVAIFFPGIPGGQPAIMFSDYGEEKKDKAILNALAFYSLICRYVRYATKVGPIDFFFPNYIYVSPDSTQVNINKINYSISGFKYEYPTFNDTYASEIVDIIGVMKDSISQVMFENDYDININLINKAFDNIYNIGQYINNILLDVNKDVDDIKSKISSYDDISEGSIYLDWDYKGVGNLDGSLRKLLDILKYNNGKFYLDAETGNTLQFRIGANGYSFAGYIPNFYYNTNEG